MTKGELLQQESSRSSKIKDLLIQLKRTYGLNYNEIAERIGVSGTFISDVLKGRKEGGDQVYAGLELLRELTVLRQTETRKPESRNEIFEELASMKSRIEELQRQFNPHYGEHQPQNLMMNEEAAELSPSSSPEEVDRAVAKAVERDLAKQFGKPPKGGASHK